MSFLLVPKNGGLLRRTCFLLQNLNILSLFQKLLRRSSVICKNRRECLLWGETIGTISNVSNVSLEDVFPRILRFNFPRILRFNRKRTSRLHKVNEVSRSRGFSIPRLPCVHYYRIALVHLRCLLPIRSIFACFSADMAFSMLSEYHFERFVALFFDSIFHPCGRLYPSR